MDKDRLFSVIRYILTAVGAWLVGKTVFGTVVDPNYWETVIGIAMAVISTVWGFVDKSLALEGFQGALRQIVAFFGGVTVSKGWISAESFTMVSGLVLSAAAWIYSWLSHRKTARLANPYDTLTVADLSGAKKVLAKANSQSRI